MTRYARMRSLGSQMANVCFNLAQQPGRTLSERDCMIMHRLRKDWDAIWQRPAKTARIRKKGT